MKGAEGGQIEELSEVAMGHHQMDIFAQRVGIGSMMVGEPSTGVMSACPGREDYIRQWLQVVGTLLILRQRRRLG